MNEQTFILVPLTNCDEYALVDIEDHPLVTKFKWHKSNLGYIVTGHESLKMHHLILGVSGMDLIDKEVHHINSNKIDNRKSNLKLLTFADHQMTRGLQKNNKGFYKGVSWKNQQGTRRGAWIAQISFQRKKIAIGRFKTAIEAAHAYDKKAKELYGEVAYLNFP